MIHKLTASNTVFYPRISVTILSIFLRKTKQFSPIKPYSIHINANPMTVIGCVMCTNRIIMFAIFIVKYYLLLNNVIAKVKLS